MKGGDVVIVYALKALAAAGALDGMALTVVMTGDEEDPGEPLDAGAQGALRRRQGRPTSRSGSRTATTIRASANIARRGFTGWTLRVKGTPAHSSQVFTDAIGAGAIYETGARPERLLRAAVEGSAAVAQSRRDARRHDGGVRRARNRAARRSARPTSSPSTRVVTGDLRTISAEQLERAKAAMREIVAAQLPRTTAELDVRRQLPADGADRRQPPAAGAVRRGQPRSRARARSRRSIRARPARPTFRSSPAMWRWRSTRSA